MAEGVGRRSIHVEGVHVLDGMVVQEAGEGVLDFGGAAGVAGGVVNELGELGLGLLGGRGGGEEVEGVVEVILVSSVSLLTGGWNLLEWSKLVGN